jgi:hypothetical protein
MQKILAEAGHTHHEPHHGHSFDSNDEEFEDVKLKMHLIKDKQSEMEALSVNPAFLIKKKLRQSIIKSVQE